MTALLEHRLPDTGTGQEGHDHDSGRIGEERPGPDFGGNVNSAKNPCPKPHSGRYRSFLGGELFPSSFR